ADEVSGSCASASGCPIPILCTRLPIPSSVRVVVQDGGSEREPEPRYVDDVADPETHGTEIFLLLEVERARERDPNPSYALEADAQLLGEALVAERQAGIGPQEVFGGRPRLTAGGHAHLTIMVSSGRAMARPLCQARRDRDT